MRFLRWGTKKTMAPAVVDDDGKQLVVSENSGSGEVLVNNQEMVWATGGLTEAKYVSIPAPTTHARHPNGKYQVVVKNSTGQILVVTLEESVAKLGGAGGGAAGSQEWIPFAAFTTDKPAAGATHPEVTDGMMLPARVKVVPKSAVTNGQKAYVAVIQV